MMAGKWLKVLDVVFHPVVFGVVFLVCFSLAIVNIFLDIVPYYYGMLAVFLPLVVFGLIGFLVDEWRSS